uniref:Uncharacterized protein n=1 Tax=viral metagenome TaxID=1070528 RepID=A0A6C0KGY1_9ZZZZ
MLSEWNKFVKKIYRAGKAENSEFTFGEALKEASKRKQEMKGGNADAAVDAAPAPAQAVTVHAPAQVEAAPAPAKVGGKKSKTANKRSKRGGKTRKVKSCKK